jgi:hypothetical protein
MSDKENSGGNNCENNGINLGACLSDQAKDSSFVEKELDKTEEIFLSKAASIKEVLNSEACTTRVKDDLNITTNSVENGTQLLNESEKDLTVNVTHDENIARTLSKGLEKKLSLIE